MLTWLLSLAVAAAASPPLNVTLTNNLLGVTTVRVNGAGLRVEAIGRARLAYAQRREAARRRERDDTAAALALSRVTSGQSTSRSVRRPPPYSGAAPPPPPPPPPPNPFRATPSSSRGESSYARRERLSRQMDL